MYHRVLRYQNQAWRLQSPLHGCVEVLRQCVAFVLPDNVRICCQGGLPECAAQPLASKPPPHVLCDSPEVFATAGKPISGLSSIHQAASVGPVDVVRATLTDAVRLVLDLVAGDRDTEVLAVAVPGWYL